MSINKTKINTGEYAWQLEHPRALGLVSARDLELPDCRWVTPNTTILLDQLRTVSSGTPVEMNIVIVSPNEGQLPLRTMAYVINTARNIRTLRSKGIPVNTVRVINPCHLNAFCDDGNAESQIAYGKQFMAGMTSWVYERFPDLQDLGWMLDQGFPIDGNLNELMVRARQYASQIGHTDLFQSVITRMERHGGQSEDVAALYLLGHPYAWRYSPDGLMFNGRVGNSVSLNYLPQSEMLYLRTMNDAGVDISGVTRSIGTMVSNQIVHAPYLWISESEPPLNWQIDQTDLIAERGKWTSNSNLNHTLAGKEIMGSMGTILKFLQTGK